MNLELRADSADPFALYHAPLRAVRLWRGCAAVLLVVVGALGLSLALVSMRPATVIVYDRDDSGSLRVAEGVVSPTTTAADARLFFAQALRWRYGWDSLTVGRDLQAFLQACFGPLRQSERQFLLAAVEREGRGQPTSRLLRYMQQGVAHSLLLPDDLRQIDCRKRPERRQWDCFVRAELVTSPLLSSENNAGQPVRQRLQFVGTLLEAPRTVHTPFGVVLAALHSEPVPGQPIGKSE